MYRNFAIADASRPGGFYPVCITYDGSSSYNADSDGLYFEQASGTSIGNDASIRGATKEELYPQFDPLWISKFRIMDNTDIRVFAGMTTESYNAINDNDTIGGDAVGFQFSSSRGDTTWQLITNNGGTQTTTDSGLAFVTSQIYIVEMEWSGVGTSVRFRISDQNFNALMQDTVVTSNLPAVTSDLSPLNSLQTLATAAKTCRFYWRESWY
tara:strand:+ start:216 stop:848 length:633 start_codon:yes stop_codon:yes gene_type:complete